MSICNFFFWELPLAQKFGRTKPWFGFMVTQMLPAKLIQENILKGKNMLGHGMLQLEIQQNQMHNFESFSYFLTLLLTEKQRSCAVFWTLYCGLLKNRQLLLEYSGTNAKAKVFRIPETWSRSESCIDSGSLQRGRGGGEDRVCASVKTLHYQHCKKVTSCPCSVIYEITWTWSQPGQMMKSDKLH